jgi:hypothetical protein
VLQYTGFGTTGTLSGSGGSVSCGQPPPDATNNRIVACNYTNTSGITGQGTLLNLNFTVVGTSGQQSALTFVGTSLQPDPFIFNSGDPQAVISNGNFTVTTPTAATVNVGGRVLTQTGRGIRNVVITMTDSQGITRTATTTSFGYYQFADVPAGQTYVFTARGKRFSFGQNTIVQSITENTNNINFIGLDQSLSPIN